MSDRQVVVVQRQSQALPALVNLFFPPFGQLIQGRLLMFLLWLCVWAVTIALCFVVIGLFVLPFAYVLCILDAACYRG